MSGFLNKPALRIREGYENIQTMENILFLINTKEADVNLIQTLYLMSNQKAPSPVKQF